MRFFITIVHFPFISSFFASVIALQQLRSCKVFGQPRPSTMIAKWSTNEMLQVLCFASFAKNTATRHEAAMTDCLNACSTVTFETQVARKATGHTLGKCSVFCLYEYNASTLNKISEMTLVNPTSLQIFQQPSFRTLLWLCPPHHRASVWNVGKALARTLDKELRMCSLSPPFFSQKSPTESRHLCRAWRLLRKPFRLLAKADN